MLQARMEPVLHIRAKFGLNGSIMRSKAAKTLTTRGSLTDMQKELLET